MKILNKRNLVSVYARWLFYTKSWSSNKKIVMIESDDWGSIRTSNKEAYDALLDLGYDMSKSPYAIDALESNEDLLALYETLNSVKDKNGNPACFTANMILANPDFEAIEKNNFSKYEYETVDKTLNKYESRDKVRILWKEGLESKLFFPQLHARDHVRYWDWMGDLRQNNIEARETFNLRMCGVPRIVSKRGTSYFQPPYIDDEILKEQKVDLNRLITEGADLFKTEFGFASKTTIAPNCGWTNSTEKVWIRNNIKYIQGGFLQEHHLKNKIKYIPHYLGEKSQTEGLIYLVRNCTFEPSKSTSADYWKKAFKQVENAFNKNTPAIISSHRVNYIGSIKESNRANGIKQLSKLLNNIIEKYPEVIFMNTMNLGDLIMKNENN